MQQKKERTFIHEKTDCAPSDPDTPARLRVCSCRDGNQTAWTPLGCEDFTIYIPEDLIYQITDTIEENTVFMVLYPNYDESAAFNTIINFVWSSDVQDLSAIDAATVGQQIMTSLCAI